jgi:hypothetical protein
MEGAEETEFVIAGEGGEAEAFEVADDLAEAGWGVDVDLSQEGGVAVEGEVGEFGDEEVLVEEEVLDGSALIGGVIDEDEGEDSDAGEGVTFRLGGVGFEVKEIARMSDKGDPELCEPLGVILVTG